MTGMIVTVSASGLDGKTVNWYRSETAERNRTPILTASRNGVRIDCWLDDLEGGLLDVARQTWQQLREDPNADVSTLITHQRCGVHLMPVPSQ